MLQDYTFMIGAWLFTVGTYLTYLLIINAEYTHADLKRFGATQEEIDAIDANQDGTIDRKELAKFDKRLSEVRHARDVAANTKDIGKNQHYTVDDLIEMGFKKEDIDAIDTNQDGNIDSSELQDLKARMADIGSRFDRVTSCRFKWLRCPSCPPEMGETGALLNVMGAMWYNVNTMYGGGLYGDPQFDKSQYNWWYVGTGAVGSIFFIFASILEGEHNGWRKFTPRKDGRSWMSRWNPCAHKKGLPLWNSVMDFWGATLFLIAYMLYWNDEDSPASQNRWVTDWWVAGPFTVGSIFFSISAWNGILMWKTQQFGLGYAKTLDEDWDADKITGDLFQQFYLLVIIGNAVIVWCEMGFLFTLWYDYKNNALRNGFAMELWFKCIVYHGMVFMMSAVHKAPARPPYDLMYYGIILISTYGFISDAYVLAQYASFIDASDLPL